MDSKTGVIDTTATDNSNAIWEACSESFDLYFKALKAGRLRGLVALVGEGETDVNVELVEELLQRDIWVTLSIPGSTIKTMEERGLLGFDGLDYAGDGITEFCDNLDVPPVVIIDAVGSNEEMVALFTRLADQSTTTIASLPIAAIVAEQSTILTIPSDITTLKQSFGTLLTMDSDPMQTADSIDAHIRKVRRSISWCDRYHCTIHS